MLQHREVPLEVHGDHRVPLRFVHAGDEAVAQDAGVVDHDVEAAELVDRLLDSAFRAVPGGDVVGVGDCRAAGGVDLGDDLVRRAGVSALAGVAAAEVVDDDLGAFSGEQQRVFAADAAAGAGDDGDPAF